MAMTINTNVASLNAQRNVYKSQDNLATSLQRLSTGLRVNSAKDDAAGLAISERFTAQIKGLNQAARNANDGISLAQTAEGELAQVTSNLQRIRELSVQAANGTNSSDDREALQKEVTQLTEEVGRVLGKANFNGQELFTGAGGTSGSFSFQVGANAGDTIDVTISTMTNSGLGIDALDISTASGASAAITAIDDALDQVNSLRADLGAVQNRFSSLVTSLQTSAENLSASRGRIIDTDFAQETANLTKGQILQQAGVAMLSQANSMPQSVLSLLQ
ncbi:flagellin [Amnimonas aquatica]|uniref:Flagellin n=1 Tax=Amnimonas aquatica TaxID=2094561 RepID=A0A2P6AQR0_9GAMM|nr:flagellin [Amnimonas aquatica]PQA31659.1 flagellin FliC [Amnimonas aquatica]